MGNYVNDEYIKSEHLLFLVVELIMWNFSPNHLCHTYTVTFCWHYGCDRVLGIAHIYRSLGSVVDLIV